MNNDFCFGLMFLIASQNTNIAFICHTKIESRKWMGACIENKNILLFNFRLTDLWCFRQFTCVSANGDSLNELLLAKKLDC